MQTDWQKQVSASTLEGAAISVVLKGLPNTCPVCSHKMTPHIQAIIIIPFPPVKKVQVAFRCANSACQELFIGTYNLLPGRTSDYLFFKSEPLKYREKEFPATIKEISVDFVKIYNQALAAEAANLNEIVGIGLRKSLEFLIKDFALKMNPDKDEEIKKCSLASCISNYVADTNIKECAKRATWLGNDETHYIKKWEDKDIEDLKRLVHLTVNWIDSVILTKKYTDEMASS